MLEFVLEEDERQRIVPRGGVEVGGIDDRGSGGPHRIDRFIEEREDARVLKRKAPRYADACPTEAIGIEELRVVGVRVPRARFRRIVTSVDARQWTEENSGVPHGARHRTGGIL